MPLSRIALIAGLALALAGCNDPAGPAAPEPADAAATPPAPAPGASPYIAPPEPAGGEAVAAAEPPAPNSEDESMSESCNAEAAAAAIGQVATPAVIEQARKDAGARMARTLAPDQMVTMEYLEGRLNIKVDDNNVVTGLTCG